MFSVAKIVSELIHEINHMGDEHEKRQISKITSVSRPVIKEYIGILTSKGFTFKMISKMNDDEVENIFNSQNVEAIRSQKK